MHEGGQLGNLLLRLSRAGERNAQSSNRVRKPMKKADGSEDGSCVLAEGKREEVRELET